MVFLYDDTAFLGFDCGALSGHDYKHGMGFFLDIFHDFPEVVFDQVVEVLLLLGLGLQFLRHQEDLIVDLGVLVITGLDFCIEVGDFLGDVFVHGAADPSHLVLVDFFDIADALEDVGDVVDPALLHAQFSGCFVDVEHEVVLAFDEPDEALGQQGQRVLAFSLLLFLALFLFPDCLLFFLSLRGVAGGRLEDPAEFCALGWVFHLHLLATSWHYNRQQLSGPVIKSRPGCRFDSIFQMAPYSHPRDAVKYDELCWLITFKMGVIMRNLLLLAVVVMRVGALLLFTRSDIFGSCKLVVMQFR